MSSGNSSNGGIAGVGVIGIFLIIIGAWLPLSHDWKWGLILLGISVLLGLLSGATFSMHWVVGLVFLVAAVIVFSFALRAFSNAISPTSQTMIPMPIGLPLLLETGFLL